MIAMAYVDTITGELVERGELDIKSAGYLPGVALYLRRQSQ